MRADFSGTPAPISAVFSASSAAAVVVASTVAGFGLFTHSVQRLALAGGGHFFVLDGVDLVEDVGGHGAQAGWQAPQARGAKAWVACTNRFKVSRAQPLARASRARSMPLASVSATSAA